MTSPKDKPDLSRLRIHREEGGALAGRTRHFPVGVWIIFAAIAASLITWFAFRPRRPVESPRAETTVTNPAPSRRAAAKVLNATGYVVAQRRAAVSSKATGRLKELRVKEGDAVAANQIMGILENDDMLQLVEKAKAMVAAAQARVASGRAEVAVAELEEHRVARLIESRVASQREKDAAHARYQRALADLSAHQADVAVTEASLKEAEVNLEYTYIRAPFDGTVLTKNADIGEVVAPFGSSADARAAIVTIADMSSLQVEADVSETNLAKVKLGQRCKIALDSFPDKPYQGVVDSIVPTVDRAKATVLVKIRFLDKDKNVIPEMSAKVEFDLE
jgi:HlyD family secretion protein